MACYVSASRRLRRTIVIASAVGLLAFAFGWLVGRQQVPSIEQRVADVQESAHDIATGLERLGIEYEQVLAGTDALDSSVLIPLDQLRTDMQQTMDRAPWMTRAQRSSILDALAQARQSAVDQARLDDFVATTTVAANAVRAAFDLRSD